MRAEEANERALWNVMVYIAADDVLTNFAIESLKQLKRAAGNDVVVAAQLDSNIEELKKMRQYVFRQTKSPLSSIEENLERTLERPKSMADPHALTGFIEWVREKEHSQDSKSCLVLWCHGPELLLDASVAQYANRKLARYMTPQQLTKALEAVKTNGARTNGAKANGAKANGAKVNGAKVHDAVSKDGKPKIDFVVLDACSMSMLEMACELQGHADYMIASQEEVPDFSLPYDQFLELLRAKKDQVEKVCKEAPILYKLAYHDFVLGPETEMKGVTLSSLKLANLDTITTAIQQLAQALKAAVREKKGRSAILKARKEARGFVGGIFVDLCDFCDRLGCDLKSHEVPGYEALANACDAVCAAIDDRGDGACVIENQAEDSRCHGLSVYFPYLNFDDEKQMRQPFVKGGADLINKGGADLINKSGLEIVNKAGEMILSAARHQLIHDFEENYASLKFAQCTGWYDFIVCGWSRILERKVDLDLRYSARQCEYNMLLSKAKPYGPQGGDPSCGDQPGGTPLVGKPPHGSTGDGKVSADEAA